MYKSWMSSICLSTCLMFVYILNSFCCLQLMDIQMLEQVLYKFFLRTLLSPKIVVFSTPDSVSVDSSVENKPIAKLQEVM